MCFLGGTMRRIMVVSIFSLFLIGCVATKSYRASSLFESYFDNRRTIAVMPPDVKMYQLTAGGIPELIDEWSDSTKAELLSCIREELNSMRSVNPSFIDDKTLSEEDRDFIKEQNGLYSAVGGSIIWHTYTQGSIFKHKMDNFDYTLGSELSKISDITNADALLFCTARNYIWTAGRTSTQVFATLFGALTGVVFILPSGPELLAVSLIDAKTGDVIWFHYIPMQGDLRKKEVCKEKVAKLFSSLPKDM